MRIDRGVCALSLGLLLALPTIASAQNQGPAPATSAGGQLNNGTSGHQSTGQTFDGGRTITDATPSGSTGSDFTFHPSSSTARSPSNQGSH
jgi:hypothetical protein